MGLSRTFINDVQFNDVEKLTGHTPLDSTVDVSVEDMNANTEIFAVDLVDGKFDPERGSMITGHGQSERDDGNLSEEPDFDLDVIVGAAEKFIQDNTQSHRTSGITDVDESAQYNSYTRVSLIQFNGVSSFGPDNPLGAQVGVDAYNAEGRLTIFMVELTDGRFRPELGCKITALGSDEPYIDKSDYPTYDLNKVARAAKEFVDQHTTIHETGGTTNENAPIWIIETPNKVHVAPEDADYANGAKPANARFMEAIASFDTYQEAEQYVQANLESDPEFINDEMDME